jgi:hypothetical protein
MLIVVDVVVVAVSPLSLMHATFSIINKITAPFFHDFIKL